MSDKPKRVPSRATLRKRASNRVIDAEDKLSDAKVARAKWEKVNDDRIGRCEAELASARVAFAQFSEPVPEADDADHS